jgi:hypothetical protein
MADQDLPKMKKLSAIDLRTSSYANIILHIEEMSYNNDCFDVFFEKQHSSYSSLINKALEKLHQKDFKMFAPLSAKVLSIRQMLQDDISKSMAKLSKANSKYKQTYGDRIDYYTTGFGLKVSDSTRKNLIERDLAERIRQKEILENHIEFMRECRITCDNIGYSIKNLTQLSSLLMSL